MKKDETTKTTSQARIDANRENAKKSTGPRSQAGKAASSRNRLVHGLRSNQTLLPEDDPQRFQAILDDHRTRFQPVGGAEEDLVLRIASIQWRLGRVFPMETAILRDRLNYDVASRDKYRNAVHNDDIKYAEEDGEPAPPPLPDAVEGDLMGRAFMADCRATKSLSLLARYETSLDRSFDQSLQRLKYLQTARLAPSAAPRRDPTPRPPPALQWRPMSRPAIQS